METQERILLKAHELFMLYGIRNVSMDEIALHLSISKKTIYQHFPDKDELVLKVVQYEIGNNQCKCGVAQSNAKDPIDEMFLALTSIKEMLSMMNPLLMQDLERFHPKGFKVLQEHKHSFIYQFIKKNLEDGMKLKLYRPDIDVDILAKIRNVSVFQIFNADIFPNPPYSIVNVLEHITIHFLHGIVTTKGLTLLEKYKTIYNQQTVVQ